LSGTAVQAGTARRKLMDRVAAGRYIPADSGRSIKYDPE
jgi:hypothetical protein